MIAIVDYGVGNLANVARALVRAGARDIRITREPGVGNCGHCARELHRVGMHEPVIEARRRGVPILGLCVGMQLFFEQSEEDPSVSGLAFYRGRVRKLRGPVRIPHTGWNQLRLVRRHPWLADVADAAYFYFVHSYAPEPLDERAVVATVEHGGWVNAAVGSEGMLGLQFHPEKSGAMGIRALTGFVRASDA